MAKVTKAALVKNIKALNRKKLTDKVAVTGDVEDLMEDFISAIEDIDDAGKIDDVPDSIIDYYEGLIDEDGDEEEQEEKKTTKRGRKKAAAKDEDEDDEEDDEDEDDEEDGDVDLDSLEEELADMNLRQIKKYIKDNDVDIDITPTRKNLDDVVDAILEFVEEGGGADDEDDDEGDEFDLEACDDVDEILEYCDENDIKLTERQEGFPLKRLKRIVAKKMGAAEKDTGKSTKKTTRRGSTKKTTKKEPDVELPKGLRKNTLPAELYMAVAEGEEDGATMKSLATMVAKAKGNVKEPLSYYGFVQRTIARKVAKCANIVQRHASSGAEGDAVFVVEED